MQPLRRLLLALASFAFVVVGGTVGYVVLEGVSWLDALYMTVITVSTVGFREAFPLDDAGRILTMFVVVLGLGSLTFATVTAIEFLVEGHLRDILGRRAMDRQLQRLDQHTIVCGFGRVGRHVARQLAEEGRPVVVVDPDRTRLAMADERGLLHLEGDAGAEEVLIRAGLERARSLVACTADDAENVLITLTAKGLNPSVFVIARLKSEENESKARRAGADRVIAPSVIGGRRIAALIARPYVVDFLDVVTHGSRLDLVLEEVDVRADSELVGQSLRGGTLRDRFGATVLAIRRADGSMDTRPQPDARIVEGDVLVVLGARDDLDRLQVAAGDGAAPA